MLLWVGLGNPGASYARNRHNIGFLAVERIAATFGFSAWRKRFNGEVADGLIAGRKVLALKPLTYMNESGASVQGAMTFHKLPPASVTVFHDELDLAAGKLRVKKGGGAAGHNGLRSIDSAVGREYWRVRLGIGHPGDKTRVTGHVLGDFSTTDRPWLETLLDALGDAAPLLAKGETEPFMTRVALLTRAED
jgi:peptidyl-tRNA hydrolase, PTH1 family